MLRRKFMFLTALLTPLCGLSSQASEKTADSRKMISALSGTWKRIERHVL